MKMSVDEYNSLREEMISRINATYTLATAAASFSAAAWAVGIALLVIPFNTHIADLGSNDVLSLLYLIPAIFSFATILVLVPTSIKSSENILQCTAISCYLQVFHEFRNNEYLNAWETINTSINMKKLSHGIYHKFSWLFNAEYAFLALISLLLYSSSAVIYIRSENVHILGKRVVIILGVIAFILVALVFYISSRIVASKKNIEEDIKRFAQKGIKFNMLSNGDLKQLYSHYGSAIGDTIAPCGQLRGKRIVAINNSLVESTSQIMFSIANQARSEGCIYYTASPKYKKEISKVKIKSSDAEFHIFIGSIFSGALQKTLNKYTGYNGIFSHFTTLIFLCRLYKCKPDLIHIHNLHDSNLNLNMLFRFIRKRSIPIVWTLHDCWPFTGNCIYYGMARCDKWKKSCQKCTQPDGYPYRKFDKTKQMHKRKKKWFSNQKMTLVTPSRWLKEEAKCSFLGSYPIKVVNNGIDLDVFTYNSKAASNLREMYSLEGKFVVLGVASLWDKRKGLDIFNKLAEDKDLSDKFVFVAIGVNESDRKKIEKSIISIYPIRGQPSKLAAWYSAADVFLNPTRDDNFPTTNLESLACGTGVITFKTGGSPEAITSECGKVIEAEDYEALKKALFDCKNRGFLMTACRRQAEKYRNVDRFLEYLDLYSEILGSN